MNGWCISAARCKVCGEFLHFKEPLTAENHDYWKCLSCYQWHVSRQGECTIEPCGPPDYAADGTYEEWGQFVRELGDVT